MKINRYFSGYSNKSFVFFENFVCFNFSKRCKRKIYNLADKTLVYSIPISFENGQSYM